jgi:hypothetical protein
MKNTLAFVFLIFTINTKIMAQVNDSVPANKVAEQGAQGDIILGKQNKKNQLNASPELLQQKDSVQKEASVQPKKKKPRSKSRKDGK